MNSRSSDIALLCIGDELLDGRTADKNAHHLGGRLSVMGIHLAEVRFVDDRPDAITAHLQDLASRFALIVTSGGLGPTTDDRTRTAVAAAAGVALVRDSETAGRLRAKFRSRDRPWSEANDRQAWFPEGATIYPSACGTADAFLTPCADSEVLCLPGVPHEFRELFEQFGVPLTQPNAPLVRRELLLFGLGESGIATLLEPHGEEGVDVTYKADSPYVSVGFRGESAGPVHACADSAEKLLAKWLVPGGHQSMGAALGDVARAANAKIATVESCTGGLVASSITDVPGSSDYFWGGWVTYANEAKVLGVSVDPKVIAQDGAVSPNVASAMALGALAGSPASAAVSVSGVAGPGGGSDEKPVGLVYVAVVGPFARVVVKAVFAGRSRASFKRHVVALAQLALIQSLVGLNGALESVSGVEWCRPIE